MSDERKYYRSSVDGQLGYLVERDGKHFIKLDRPQEEILRPWSEGNSWIPEVEKRPLSKAQVAKICFDADKAYCQAVGVFLPKRDWLDLSDKQRILWMESGPKDAVRAAIWTGLNMILEPLTR